MRISDWSSDVCSSDLRCSSTRKRCSRASPSSPSSCTTGIRKLRLRLSRRQVRLASNWGLSSAGHWRKACFNVGVSPNSALERMYRGKRSKAGFNHQNRNIAREGESHSSRDRKSVVWGKGGSGRVEFGGRRILKKKTD